MGPGGDDGANYSNDTGGTDAIYRTSEDYCKNVIYKCQLRLATPTDGQEQWKELNHESRVDGRLRVDDAHRLQHTTPALMANVRRGGARRGRSYVVASFLPFTVYGDGDGGGGVVVVNKGDEAGGLLRFCALHFSTSFRLRQILM
ncbi:unnamed protein product [Nippostrongylus brasiliensis]|uniref:Uncharacterized protein n=1 Tax=Nippostrongylus brasiliensis TaxID=27835 RepID=A0A0N4XZ19_NIPBR|nr:unnamed protein product [Nippostrongylus brasiliensis]